MMARLEKKVHHKSAYLVRRWSRSNLSPGARCTT